MEYDTQVTNGKVIVDAYNDYLGVNARECPIRDMLADLQYYCREHGIDFDYELERSRSYVKDGL